MTSFQDRLGLHGSARVPQQRKPKKKVTSPASADRAVQRAVGAIDRSTQGAASSVTRATRRAVASSRRPVQGPPVPRGVAEQNRRNAELDRINRAILDSVRRDRGEPTSSKYQSTLDIINRATHGSSRDADPLDAVLAELDRTRKSTTKPAPPNLQTGGLNDLQRLLGATGGSRRSIGGFLTNLGAGAVRTITDLPAGAQLAGEVALYPVVKATNMVQSGGGAGGPKRGAYLQGAEDQITGDVQRAKAGTIADYRRRYGPLVQGDVGKFASTFYADPLPTILDVGGAYSAIGRAPEAAARAASALTVGRTSERLAKVGSRSRIAPGELDAVTGAMSKTGGKLYRAPRRVVGRATAETPKGKVRVASREIEVPRRPYSPNVITRAVQRGADSARARIVPSIERAAEARQPPPGAPASATSRISRLVTPQAKFDRAQSRATRDLIFRREQMAAGAANRDSAAFIAAVRKLKQDRNEGGVKVKGLGAEHIALRLHLEDLLRPRAGMSATDLRDAVVARMEHGIKKAETRGERTDLTRRQVEQIKNIPPDLLTLRDMSNPGVVRVATALQEGRRLDEISQGRSVRAGVISPSTATEMKGRTSALLLGGQEWAPALLKEMKTAGASTADRALVRASAIRETPALQAKRGALAESEAVLAGAAEMSPTKLKAAVRRRDSYFKSVRAAEDRALGFTPPSRPEMVGDKGVYIPKTAVDPMGGGSGVARRKGFSGPTAPKRDKGYLVQKGGFDMNPALLAHQAKRAAGNDVGPMSNEALHELVGMAAYLDDKGKMVVGKRAAQMARTDPDRVVLVNLAALKGALSKLDHLEEGKFLDPAEVKMFHGQGRESWLQAIPEGPVSRQYVAISKAAADVWREAPTTSPLLKGADRLLDYWKGGVLALSPRWLTNSAIGVGTQYGLLAGGDIRSIVQGVRRGSIRDAVPDTVVLNNLAHDVGLKGGVDTNRLERAFAAGFRINNRMESAWRRAAYINRSKRRLRDEGVKFRGLSDADIARAIDSMPPSVAREVIREVDLFMGEFRKFNRFERDVLKRGLPWYSWLRVISRLTFSLPYRSPVRAAALSTLGRAGEMGINPNDYMRPLYERGALVLGKYRIPTTGFNSAASLTGATEAATKIASNPSDALGLLGEEALSWSRPEIQTLAASTFGTTNFGNPVIAPTGYGGSVSSYAGSQAINPASGLAERSRTRIPIDEALLQAFGGAPIQAIRKAAAAGERPFDTTRTIPMVLARLEGGSTKGMFLDPAKDPYRFPVAAGLGSLVGINPQREDPAALKRRYDRALREFKAHLRATQARQRREARRHS